MIKETKNKIFYENSSQIHLMLGQGKEIIPEIQKKLNCAVDYGESKMIGEYSSILLAAELQCGNFSNLEKYMENTKMHSWEKWRGFLIPNFKQLTFICRFVHALVVLQKFKEADHLLCDIENKLFLD